MKKIKSLLALFAVVIFTACHNPNSSTSQEIDDEETMHMNEHEGHSNMPHQQMEEHGQAMEHADTTHHTEMPHMTADSVK